MYVFILLGKESRDLDLGLDEKEEGILWPGAAVVVARAGVGLSVQVRTGTGRRGEPGEGKISAFLRAKQMMGKFRG